MLFQEALGNLLILFSGQGTFPYTDPWGRPFDESYFPDRLRVAGTRIAGQFTFVLDGVQGDADFIAHIFSLNRL